VGAISVPRCHATCHMPHVATQFYPCAHLSKASYCVSVSVSAVIALETHKYTEIELEKETQKKTFTKLPFPFYMGSLGSNPTSLPSPINDSARVAPSMPQTTVAASAMRGN